METIKVNSKNSNRAFTLVELLVVISIIAILLAVLMPSLNKARQQARIVVDGSNQHQITLAVLAYTAANQNKLPPSVQGYISSAGKTVWTLPCRLNYYPTGGSVKSSLNGGSVGKILGSYIKTPKVFMTPLFADQMEGREKEFFEGNYDDKHNYLNSSYWLLWNYANTNIDFEGACNDNKAKLLVAGVLLYGDAEWAKLSWMSGYDYSGATKFYSDRAGMWWKKTDTKYNYMKDSPLNITMNAGYRDGHVKKYNSVKETKEIVAASSSGDSIYYLPATE